MMRDIRPGEPVHIKRSESHPHPVYLHGQRSMEVHFDPVPIRWGQYYHHLRAEGAIVVVEAAEDSARLAQHGAGQAGANAIAAARQRVEKLRTRWQELHEPPPGSGPS